MQAALIRARGEGPLLICGAVYAELLAHPGAGRPLIDRLIQHAAIQLDAEAGAPLWIATGLAYADYAARRRTSGGGLPRRLLADFLIGAHASLKADRLMTLDPQHYRAGFPQLDLIQPTP